MAARLVAGCFLFALLVAGSCALAGAASNTRSGAAAVRASILGAGSGHSCIVLTNRTIKCWGANKSGQLGNGTTASSRKPVKARGIANAVQVSAASENTCAVLADGTIRCWGDNYDGQLGDGLQNHGPGEYIDGAWLGDLSPVPVTVAGITNAIEVSVGGLFSCALLSDQTVKCWGSNMFGQLGDGKWGHGSADFYGEDMSPTSVTVSGITNAVEVSAGDDHACALLSDHTVRCWGDGNDGQLGDGEHEGDDNHMSVTPVAVIGITDAIEVSAGLRDTCALLSDHTLECWGDNGYGLLGDGLVHHVEVGSNNKDISVTPVVVKGIATAEQISAGYLQTCALLSDRTIRCWGVGALGDGAMDHRSTDSYGEDISRKPVEVKGIRDATQLAAGYSHACALLSGGKVKCWGANDSGQLGDGAFASDRKPVRVGGIASAAQATSGDWHSCALLSDHTIRCWGDNGRGELGNGTLVSSRKPVKVSGIRNANQVSAGGSHTCALLSDRKVKCWGYSRFDLDRDQMRWATIFSRKPVGVGGIAHAAQISAGSLHTCVLLLGGKVECWGENFFGQLGNGKATGSRNPVKVLGIRNATQVSTGGRHTCAVLSDRTVRCWGYNEYGQLGTRSAQFRSEKPVKVSGITGATEVSAGDTHTCARLSDGRVVCWGENNHGQLGNGEAHSSWTPVEVKGITNAIHVTAGGSHNCALLSDRTIRCWGAGGEGQLGNGKKIDRRRPVRVSGSTRVARVSAGAGRNCALFSDHTVKRWGSNGEEPYRVIPVTVTGIQ